MQAERTEIGSVITAIAVIRHWPRNSKIVSEQRTAPSTPSCTRLEIAWRTKTDWSMTSFSSIPPRVSRSVNSGRLSRTLLTTARVLDPSCRKTGM